MIDRIAFLSLAVFATCWLAGGCGFAPMYGSAAPDRVVVEVIEGTHGSDLRDLLSGRLNTRQAGKQTAATHSLRVELQLEHHRAAALQNRSLSTAGVEASTSSVLLDRLTGREVSGNHHIRLTYPVLPAPVASLAARREAVGRALLRLRDEIVRWVTLSVLSARNTKT